MQLNKIAKQIDIQSIDVEVILRAFAVSEDTFWLLEDEFWIIQFPELRVYPEFQTDQVVPLELEHFWQLCTWQLITVSFISFCTFIEPTEINELT